MFNSMIEFRDKVMDTCIHLYEAMGYDAHISDMVYKIYTPKLLK